VSATLAGKQRAKPPKKEGSRIDIAEKGKAGRQAGPISAKKAGRQGPRVLIHLGACSAF